MKKIISHNPNWASQFETETCLLSDVLGAVCVEAHHMGSTAIPDIPAKPIIDILMEVSGLRELDLMTDKLVEQGYTARGEYGIPERRYFKKAAIGTTAAINLHSYEAGSFQIKRHLAFRDYLRARPDLAQEYARLKEKLSNSEGVLAPNYQDAKKPYVDAISLEALRYFAR